MDQETAPPVLDEQLRAAGFMPSARAYPRSRASFEWLCKLNGVSPDKAPAAWRYASNAHMHAYAERAARETGHG